MAAKLGGRKGSGNPTPTSTELGMVLEGQVTGKEPKGSDSGCSPKSLAKARAILVLYLPPAGSYWYDCLWTRGPA